MPVLMTLGMDLARSTVWFVLLGVIFLPLERLFAERPLPILRREWAVDMGWFFFNGVVTALIMGFTAALIATTANRVLPIPHYHLPIWARMAATLVVGEFGFYWGHRLSHEIPLLWRFHAIHHSATQIDWLTSSRAHPVDFLFTRLSGFVLLSITGLARPEGNSHFIAVSLLLIFTTVWGFFIHSNVKWRLGWLEVVIATPAFHRWHHTADAHRDHNYASTLPFYDRLFGTLYLPRRAAPPAFGIDAAMPSDFVGQMLSPLNKPAA
jgi:sterol desaturase/sphingolipid hydroxylase (fatty acid hydroxylase superfamily)